MKKSILVDRLLAAEEAGDMGKMQSIIADLRKCVEDEMHISGIDDASPIGGTIHRHPAFGSIQISAPQGGDGVFFGSGVRHNQYMTISIHRAQLHRSLTDHIHAKEELIEVRLTHDQWARMVASQGRGEGTPCTINHVDGKRMPSPPMIDKRGQHAHEFEERMRGLANKLHTVISADVASLKSGNITMAQRKEIAGRIESVMQEIRNNIPFFQELFVEEMEKIVTSLKTDVEAFVSRTLIKNGIEAKPTDVLMLDDDKTVG